MTDQVTTAVYIDPHAPTHDEVGFHPVECERVAILIGLTSILFGCLTFGYVNHPDNGLNVPAVWAVAHIAAGLAAIITVRFRVRGYATAGALVSGLAIMRGAAFSNVGPGVVEGEWRQATGVLLWISFGCATWWIWSRVVARHVAWNKARAVPL